MFNLTWLFFRLKYMNINLQGRFCDNSGYAKVNKNLVSGLEKLGIKVSVKPLDKKGNTSLPVFPSCSKKSIGIDSIVPSLSVLPISKYKILYTTIETNTLSKTFLDCIHNYHEIWLTSDYSEKILKKYFQDRKTFILPDSIDTKLYQEDGPKYSFEPSLKGFIFVSVFGWSYRKGYDVLLKSYLQEFTSKDNVTLLIVAKLNYKQNLQSIKETIQKYIEIYGGDSPPLVVRFEKEIEEENMPDIYRACDAFVLFTRGEGFGLPFIESSLCGLPIIGTNWSAPTMYLNNQNSNLLEIDTLGKVQPGQMPVHYWDNLEMPNLSSPEIIINARKLLRYVFENHKKCKEKNIKLQNYIKENFSIDVVANKAKKRLETIWSKLK